MSREHAQHMRRVINFDSVDEARISCAWADCYKQGYECHKIVIHEHARSIPCDDPMGLARHPAMIFCSETHRQYWLASSGPMARHTEARNQGRIMGMLPPGYKRSVL